jgi:hypothetical protein
MHIRIIPFPFCIIQYISVDAFYLIIYHDLYSKTYAI